MSDFHAEESFAPPELEAIVRAARDYVQPTDDLRPRTLEAARDARQQRRSNRKFFGLASVILLLAATGIPGYLFPAMPAASSPPSAEVHRRAAVRSVQRGVGVNWALYEVFRELRDEQAERLNSAE